MNLPSVEKWEKPRDISKYFWHSVVGVSSREATLKQKNENTIGEKLFQSKVERTKSLSNPKGCKKVQNTNEYFKKAG